MVHIDIEGCSRVCKAPRSTFRESRPPTKCPYMALRSSIIDSEPSSFQEAADL